MKILLHDNYLCERGSTVALYDYAYFLQKILNIECYITYNSANKANNIQIIKKFEKEFTMLPYENDFCAIEAHIKNNSIDLFYIIKAGENDGKISRLVKTCVHAVFPCDPRKEKHGDAYAYVSKWLSTACSENTIPYVPHMINLPDVEENYREQLNIPKDSIVFGRYGGTDTFDIPFVHAVVSSILQLRPDAYFLFCNTNQFISHPRVLYVNSIASLVSKVKFINTCNAFLHARSRGETFGLAVLEFMSKNKPIFTFGQSPEKNHYELLNNQGYIYNTPEQLHKQLLDFTPHNINYSKVEEYTPNKVIEKFKAVFLT